jgi:type VI secretion system protein ImpK
MDDIPHRQDNQKRKSLSDIASECFMLILQLRATNNYGNAGALKTKVNNMFEDFEHKARNAGFENEKILQAKFALVAFLDESIISSSWEQKDEWLSEPLQLKLFNTFNAGEEFFTNINNFRQRTSSNKEVLEIYYVCLVLGFKGKYQLQSPENLRRVIDDLNMELHPEMFKAVDAISPNAKPKDSFVQSGKIGIPVWAYPVAAVVISILFYFVFSIMISGKADTVVETLIKLL